MAPLLQLALQIIGGRRGRAIVAPKRGVCTLAQVVVQLDKVDHMFKALGHGLVELLGRAFVIARPGKQIAQHKCGNLGKADAGGFQWLNKTHR